MANQIALRISKAILIMAGLAVFVLAVMGVVRAAVVIPAVEQGAELPALSKADDAKPILHQPAAETQPETASDFVIKRVLQIDEPFVHGYYKWDDEGVPDGEIIITVDLKAESLSVFKGGYEIGATVIKFGDALKPTPTGVFPITQKNADHVSNLYDVPMPYMMRLTNDGIAIHGADVKWGYGTRGCIGVPTEFARLLFEQVSLGDRVIVTNGKIIDLGDTIAAG
ncbi:L,D-transpeptidase family protein [Parasphingorhabdus sp. JC815]|uniref:L,D-transpeptidase family protein n=1 Tax=Parasphingorhabdus sp. JC815 TaxID=3232140 RepID=UPI0034574E42